MTKSKLQYENEELRDELEFIKVKEEIKKMVDRMALIDDLNEIKEKVEKVYNKSIAGEWHRLFGMRDNIHDMVDNLSDKMDFENLQYFNHYMYYKLVNDNSDAIKGLHTMTKDMKLYFLEHTQKVSQEN